MTAPGPTQAMDMPPVPDGPRARRSVAGIVVGVVAGAATLGGSAAWVRAEVRAAADRLANPKKAAEQAPVAMAEHAEAPYCTPPFKQVLERVLHSCGLVGQEARRGCQPADVKTFAAISDADFNALFAPLKDRGAVLLFDEGADKLDPPSQRLVEDRWLERRGARYFFVVARASKSGPPDRNQALSHRRANSVLFYLNEQFHDPDLDKQVGLLWLGEEYGQLSKEYCEWPSSRPGKKCDDEAINRSAFVSWVDCRL